jgi:hypothetical protein
VDAQSGLIVIDSNIFVIDLRYPHDRHYAANRRFLQKLAQTRQGATTIFHVLEVCGILSIAVRICLDAKSKVGRIPRAEQ